jgi:hypothetical protein
MVIDIRSYFFHRDFSAYKELLESFVVGETLSLQQAEYLAGALNDVDRSIGKGHWSHEPSRLEWSIHNAEVTYSGVNKRTLPTKPTFNRVVMLKLKSDVEPTGRLVLQYNE